MRIQQRLGWLVILAGVVGFSVHAAPRVNTPLAQAKMLLHELDYEKCLKRLEAAAQLGGTPKELTEIEIYNGLCQYNLGRRDKARSHFQAAFARDPDAELPPLLSPRIVELFQSVRPPPRPPDPVVAPTPPSDAPRKVELRPSPSQAQSISMAIAAPEPQRRTPVVAIILGSGSILSAGAATYFGLSAKASERRFNDPQTFQSEADVLRGKALSQARTANIFWGAAAATVIGAVISYFIEAGQPSGEPPLQPGR